MPAGWHSRGYLPHWNAGEIPQAITFRLADSLPQAVLADWRQELSLLPATAATLERRKRIEQALDAGYGAPLLGDPRVAAIVEEALLHFDGRRYRLHAWCIMPNHVHVIATPLGDTMIAAIVHSWKSFTATKANRLLGRSEAFWAREYFDRAIRDDAHYAAAVSYVEMNPVKARLCAEAAEWRFSSAWHGLPGTAGFQPALADAQPAPPVKK